MTVVRFTVVGDPAAQGSKRHVGRGILVESSKLLAPWRTTVVAEASQAMAGIRPLTGPLNVVLAFRVQRPKSHYRSNGELKPAAPTFSEKRPDSDKLARAILDSLTVAGVWLDDSQVASLRVLKLYARPPEHPVGVDVVVEMLDAYEVAA